MTETTSVCRTKMRLISFIPLAVSINGIICTSANYVYESDLSLLLVGSRQLREAPARREHTAVFTSLNWSFIHINASTCLKCSERPSPCMEKTRLVCAPISVFAWRNE